MSRDIENNEHLTRKVSHFLYYCNNFGHYLTSHILKIFRKVIILKLEEKSQKKSTTKNCFQTKHQKRVTDRKKRIPLI